jgi:ubiquinone/menaquinone biosynthesis C-methylase UbiE
MPDDITTGQVVDSAAAFYEDYFVPALFAQFAGPVCDAAAIRDGMAVLDVACGTGALTREALTRVGATGRAVGLDRNAAMLSVARRNTPGGEYFDGMAESLPFEDESFDAVVSQFGLMFFENRLDGLAEMGRVARPGARIAVAVWAGLDHAPGFRELASVFDETLGRDAGDSLQMPFSMGDSNALAALAHEARLTNPKAHRVEGTARFPSIAQFVKTEVRGWALSDSVDDETLAELISQMEARIDRQAGGGPFEFPCPAMVLTATAA